MLGLDGAGKTTILYALKLGHKVKTVPTVGFNIEEVTVAGITLTVWDCGGQDKVRCARFTAARRRFARAPPPRRPSRAPPPASLPALCRHRPRARVSVARRPPPSPVRADRSVHPVSPVHLDRFVTLQIRELWRYYYEGTEAVVFVVDSRDIDRIEAAKMELHKLVTEDALDGASILVFANKQDLEGALSGEKLIEALGMASLPDSVQWKVQEAIATENRGLEEGLQWVASTLPAKGWGCTLL